MSAIDTLERLPLDRRNYAPVGQWWNQSQANGYTSSTPRLESSPVHIADLPSPQGIARLGKQLMDYRGYNVAVGKHGGGGYVLDPNTGAVSYRYTWNSWTLYAQIDYAIARDEDMYPLSSAY